MRHSKFLSSSAFAAAIFAATVFHASLLRSGPPEADSAVRQALKKQVALKYVEEPLERVAADLQTKLGAAVYLDARVRRPTESCTQLRRVRPAGLSRQPR